MLTVIGCGNTNRTDDGAGVQAARRLRTSLGTRADKHVRVIDAGTAGVETMLEAADSRALIYIDACIGKAEPGSVLELCGDQLAQARHSGVSLHDFRWDHALRLARELYKDDFPDDVTVYLIEAESVDFGTQLSACVDAAVDDVVGRITDRIVG